jgi:hypothetical protein
LELGRPEVEIIVIDTVRKAGIMGAHDEVRSTYCVMCVRLEAGGTRHSE